MVLYLIAAAGVLAIGAIASLNALQARRSTAAQRVVAIVEYGLRSSPAAAQPAEGFIVAEPRQSIFGSLATWLGGVFSGRLTAVGEDAIRDQLMAAGMYTVSARTVIGYRVLATVLLPTLVFLSAGAAQPLDFAMIALALFAGWVLPLTIVQRKARRRVEVIDRSLPDLIDLLTVMIEAGLSFPAALRMASEQLSAPLSDELRLTLQEQTMGLGIDEALAHMAARADTPAMKAFVRAMSQGEKMGISTGQIMRNLANEMRNRRRARAEERAQKTPVLMLFPLVFLIFPAMFIILMTPAVMNLVHSLKGF